MTGNVRHPAGDMRPFAKGLQGSADSAQPLAGDAQRPVTDMRKQTEDRQTRTGDRRASTVDRRALRKDTQDLTESTQPPTGDAQRPVTDLRILTEGLAALGLAVTPAMQAQFAAYMDGVLTWNERLNLTAITDRTDFQIKHYLDSLLCAAQPQITAAETVIDVGTGAGFPGVPLAILFPEKRFTLVDALAKRLRVVSSLCTACGIGNVTTVHARAEDLAHEAAHRERYDLCVSRAVAPLPVLAEYCLPFLRVGGWLLAYKGPDAQEELATARGAIRALGGGETDVQNRGLAAYGLDHRIVYIQKVRPTPPRYPRKAGTPAKDPLH